MTKTAERTRKTAPFPKSLRAPKARLNKGQKDSLLDYMQRQFERAWIIQNSIEA
jgi:hypothetical protein